MFDSIALDIPYQKIQYKNHTITIKRLDLIHPYISGNKFFKLKYNLEQAQKMGAKTLITFGGAYSNHIAATAYAAHFFGFKSIGFIRGEELANRTLNPTLTAARDLGMHLQFISREDYKQRHLEETFRHLQQTYPDSYIIPEGGTNTLAISGCTEILSDQDLTQFTTICCAVGTGGTIAGLIKASQSHHQILGFSALKGDFLTDTVAQLVEQKNWLITDRYCAGGYAKTVPELMQFIEDFERDYNIPLEQIYTGKMLWGIFDLIDQDFFTKDARILVIHSGGLQGRMT